MGTTTSSSYNPQTRIWSGDKNQDLYHPHASVGQIIYQRIRINPKNVIQINDSEGIKLTNEQVLSMSVKVALRLQHLEQGDFVGIMASNTSYVLPLCYGCLLAAIPFHPINWSLDKKLVLHFWSQSRPKLIFCDASAYDIVQSVVTDLKLNASIYIIKDYVEGAQHLEDIFEEYQVPQSYLPSGIKDGNQTAVVLCSSGTTGLPKTVNLSYNRLKSHYAMTCFNNRTSEDVYLTFATLDWFSSYDNLLTAAMTGCVRLVTCEPFSPELCFNLVDKYKVTYLGIYMNVVNAIKNFESPRKLESLTTVLSAGIRLSEETKSRFRNFLSANCKLIETYGCTEKGTIAANLANIPGSCGALFTNVEVKLVDDNENLLGPNEIGEIITRNSVAWLGYLNNEEVTREVYDKDTDWYKTGDLGRFDDKGNLYIVGRLKEMIRYNGSAISPTELELHISKMAQVSDVCVVGVPYELHEQLPAALVVKSSEINEQDIVKYVSQSMPEFKHLRGGVYFVDKMPRTSYSGKVDRRKARDLVVELWRKNSL